jgi:hypothetical protein
MTAPQVPDSASPFWMRLYGHWVQLQGIMPVVDKTSQRQFSELTTVDGHRYVQRAPSAPRSWELDYRYATAAATAALESAAYDYNYSDPSMRTLFLDTNEAKVNMVPPNLLGLWTQNSDPQMVINVGEANGLPIWMPSYGVDDDVTPAYQEIDIPVRGGVTYTAAVWSAVLGSGSVALQISGAAVGSANGLTGSTAANPHQPTIVFTPVADGTVTVATVAAYSAGLMVYEGNCVPTSYRAGRRMPCSIAVQDAKTTTNIIWRDCDPCKLPREHTAWVIQEVGMDAVTPMDVGVS